MKRRKLILDDVQYHQILVNVRDAHDRIQEILNCYYKQKRLKIKGEPWTRIVLNNKPDYLRFDPEKWMSFVEIYLQKRRDKKKKIVESMIEISSQYALF